MLSIRYGALPPPPVPLILLIELANGLIIICMAIYQNGEKQNINVLNRKIEKKRGVGQALSFSDQICVRSKLV